MAWVSVDRALVKQVQAAYGCRTQREAAELSLRFVIEKHREYAAAVDTIGLEYRLVEHWRQAAQELGIRVTAPVELQDASGQRFSCEAFVHDFGSRAGAVVVSPKTERRVGAKLRNMSGEIWVSGSERRQSAYNRGHYIEELLDWGWYGKAGEEPSWYSERVPRSGCPPI